MDYAKSTKTQMYPFIWMSMILLILSHCGGKEIQYATLADYTWNDEPVLPDSPELQSLIQYAWDHHPRIKAATYRIQAAEADKAHAEQVLRSVPLLDVGIANRMSPGDWGLNIHTGFSIEIPASSQRLAEEAFAHISIQSAKQELAYFKFRLAVEIESQFRSIQLIQEKVHILQEQHTILDNWKTQYEHGLELGLVTQMDVYMLSMQMQQVSLNIQSMQQSQKEAENTLCTLITAPPTLSFEHIPAIPAVPNLEESVDFYMDAALQHRIEIQSLFSDIHRVQGQLVFQKSQLFPGIAMGIEYELEDFNEHKLAASVSIPIPVFYSMENSMMQLSAKKQALEQDLHALCKQIGLEVHGSIESFKDAIALEHQFQETIVVQMAEIHQEMQQQLEWGVGTIYRLLYIQQQMLTIQLDHTDVLADVWRTYNSIKQAVGTTL